MSVAVVTSVSANVAEMAALTVPNKLEEKSDLVTGNGWGRNSFHRRKRFQVGVTKWADLVERIMMIMSINED